jgi:hypothetical protein
MGLSILTPMVPLGTLHVMAARFFSPELARQCRQAKRIVLLEITPQTHSSAALGLIKGQKSRTTMGYRVLEGSYLCRLRSDDSSLNRLARTNRPPRGGSTYLACVTWRWITRSYARERLRCRCGRGCRRAMPVESLIAALSDQDLATL